MKISKRFITLISIAFTLIRCSEKNEGDKFVGNYSSEKNRSDTVFSIVRKANNLYILRPSHIKMSKEVILNYDSKLNALISAFKDTAYINNNGDELRFTNDDFPRSFYKIKN